MLRLVLVASAVLFVALAAPRVSARPLVAITPCTDVILNPGDPTAGGYRLILGTVAVPPPYLPQTVATKTRPWRYWRKAGLVVRAGRRGVTIAVPTAWRSRAGIIWGNYSGVYERLRILGCQTPAGGWNAYAGGFYLRTRTACVPLTFTVGRHSRTVRFGVGRRCR